MIKKKRYPFICILLTGLAIVLFHGSALGGSQTFTGKAFDVSGGLEYIEQHDMTYESENVVRSRTTYFDPDQKVIGHLSSEYTPSPRVCSYTFTDLRKQYRDGVRVMENQICLFRKKSPDAEEETLCLPRAENQIIGQGFHHFIVNNLDAIADGNIFHVKLAFPSRLDQFKFRILKRNIMGEKLFVRLEIENWVLRLFTPHVDAVYDLKSGRLMTYEGVSNLADASGQFKKVQINYIY